MQRRSAEWLRDRLRAAFGPPAPQPQDPVEILVATILSQNTNDANRDRAYASLLSHYQTFDRVADADEAEIAQVVRTAGLQAQKARALRAVLRRIRALSGEMDLGFLRRMPPGDAFAWLRASRGVGAKTAAIVLLFGFGMPFFPVDTHIARVLRRFGVVPPTGDPFRHANAALPRDPELLLELHLLLIHLGRTLCRPRRPACEECPIVARCKRGRTARNGGT